MSKSEYPSILLIYTGGTIGMIENPETGALEAFNFDRLQENVPELKRFNYHICSYQFKSPIDSSDMEPSLWAKLVKIIHENYDKFDGFVILHGTDTMAYTAHGQPPAYTSSKHFFTHFCTSLPYGGLQNTVSPDQSCTSPSCSLV